MLPFKLEDENIKQTLKIKLPEKIENESESSEAGNDSSHHLGVLV